MRKVQTTPQEAASLYVERISNARSRIEMGVRNVTVSPMEKAAAAQAKMLKGITEAINSGKWARGLKKVTLEEWKTAFLNKGLNRIADGAAAAKGKMEVFYEDLFKHQNGLLVELDKMPDLTLQNSIDRMVFFTRGMANFTH